MVRPKAPSKKQQQKKGIDFKVRNRLLDPHERAGYAHAIKRARAFVFDVEFRPCSVMTLINAMFAAENQAQGREEAAAA